jgi:hypothetical protein
VGNTSHVKTRAEPSFCSLAPDSPPPAASTVRNAVASWGTFYDELSVDKSRLVGEEGKGF